MTNEIANIPDSTPARTAPAPASPARMSDSVDLEQWARRFTAVATTMQQICSTSVVPQAYKGKPDEATAVAMAGAEYGMEPLAALRNIFIVHGMPAMYARTMQGLCEAYGVFEFTELSDTSVTVRARRKESKSWTTITWTMERARVAGYTGNKKYQTNPQEMLKAKAVAEVCRTVFADVLTGVATYSAEEIELEQLGEVPTPPSATASLTSAPAHADSGEPENITHEDWSRVVEAARAHGVEGADLAAIVAERLGREIPGPGHIKKSELATLLDAFPVQTA